MAVRWQSIARPGALYLEGQGESVGTFFPTRIICSQGQLGLGGHLSGTPIRAELAPHDRVTHTSANDSKRTNVLWTWMKAEPNYRPALTSVFVGWGVGLGGGGGSGGVAVG